jgi:lipoprotein-anchoring transpeptidase ErfK/SrfK
MRKSILLALGIAAMSLAGAATADAAVRTYWDQATGKWMKYDTNVRRVQPLTDDQGNTTSMGKVQAYKGGSSIPRKTVDYSGPFRPGTIVVNTSERRLYYILPDGQALKYGVGVGREGFQWAGVEQISRKAEWPGWTPPPEMIAREKKKGRILPAYMEGGPNNPLGARALYIGGTLYRIHGSNEPWTMGQAVSSGCIRMTNEDVSHLYERVKIGSRVVVLRGDESPARLAALANPPPPKKDVMVADARVKDDALASIGVGLGVAVAGTVPAPEAATVDVTASVTPVEPVSAPEAEAIEAPLVTISLPENRTKDDVLVIVTPVVAAEVVVEDEDAAPLAEAPLVATAPTLPVDETAKDDDLSVAVGSGAEPAEPEMQGDAAAVEVEEAIAEPQPVDPVTPAAPAAKDDGLATDLGGATVPIKGEPKLGDDKAAINASVEPATVAN